MRYLYGASPADYAVRAVAVASVSDGTVQAAVVDAAATMTVHEAPFGNQVTDLLGADGATPVQTVTVQDDGTFPFYAPEDFQGTLYVQGRGGRWYALTPSTLADTVAGQDAAIGTASTNADAALQRAEEAYQLAEQNTGGGITELPTTVDSYPAAFPAAIVWTGSEWPARSTVTTDPNRVVLWVGNPGGASPGDEMLDDDIWTQG